ncbi:B3 domain-containing protein Os05g0481400-like [Cornus florida]|uniref:B3 domain-containing protein Os05g0481400-like n=1 Tax=Cornus florida TaxID=4283 RepID=UPI00289B59DF|nr:B3 domain-containing protein Os05g0481400-like [Cornus florida]
MRTKERPGSIPKHAVPDHERKSMRCKRKRATKNALNSPGKVKSSIMIQAEQIQLSLGTEFPSFVKLMVKSHVSTCFMMRFPISFCKSHLPKQNSIIILEMESGEQYKLKFIADEQGLSAGWSKFVTLHKLLEGDVLVFQLIEANKFKVYIIRAYDFTEVDGALGLQNLVAHTKQNDSG